MTSGSSSVASIPPPASPATRGNSFQGHSNSSCLLISHPNGPGAAESSRPARPCPRRQSPRGVTARRRREAPSRRCSRGGGRSRIGGLDTGEPTLLFRTRSETLPTTGGSAGKSRPEEAGELSRAGSSCALHTGTSRAGQAASLRRKSGSITPRCLSRAHRHQLGGMPIALPEVRASTATVRSGDLCTATYRRVEDTVGRVD